MTKKESLQLIADRLKAYNEREALLVITGRNIFHNTLRFNVERYYEVDVMNTVVNPLAEVHGLTVTFTGATYGVAKYEVK